MTAPARVRLSSPADMAAALPTLVGHMPVESAVVVFLRRKQVCLTARVDMPETGDGAALALTLAGAARRADANAALIFNVTQRADRGRPVSDRLVRTFAAAKVDLVDVVAIWDGRFRSLVCENETCCPADGLPVPASTSEGLLEAEHALDGRSRIDSREGLAAQLAAPAVNPWAALQAVSEATAERDRIVAERGLSAWRTEALDHTLGLLGEHTVSQADAARCAVSLTDVAVRDTVLSWEGQHGRELLTALLLVVPQVPDAAVAGVGTVAAWVAYLAGDGLLANVLLERIAVAEPEYRLAGMLSQVIAYTMPPAALREVLAGIREEGVSLEVGE